jgi:hypothetical protein
MAAQLRLPLGPALGNAPFRWRLGGGCKQRNQVVVIARQHTSARIDSFREGAVTDMADYTSSLSFQRRHPFWWFVIAPAGLAGSVWGKRLGEDHPLLGHIVFILGLVLIAIGHGWAINWAYVRLAGHHRHA